MESKQSFMESWVGRRHRWKPRERRPFWRRRGKGGGCGGGGGFRDGGPPAEVVVQFLFDKSCADYKYYEYRIAEKEKFLSQSKDIQTPHSGGMSSTLIPKSISAPQRSMQQQNYQTPASALYEYAEQPGSFVASGPMASAGRAGESNGPSDADPIAMMEFYIKKTAQEERRRQPKQSKNEMLRLLPFKCSLENKINGPIQDQFLYPVPCTRPKLRGPFSFKAMSQTIPPTHLQA